MSLTTQINEDLKNAMRSKDEAALRALRAIKAAILLARTEKSGNEELTTDHEIKILQKLVKQRKESIEIYQKQDRHDLSEAEIQEIATIEKYLPSQLSDDAIRALVKEAISESGAKSAQEIGKVMPIAIKKVAGQADNKKVSEIIREELTNS
jgi:uncharacterized protein YqeY